MKIQILNKNRKKQIIHILKKNLPNYKKLNKKTYIRKELYNKLKKKTTTKPYKKIQGTTKYTDKKYIRYYFKLYRRPINTIQEIDHLMQKLLKKYSLIKNKNKNYNAQRIGINISSDPKDYTKIKNKTTNRQNKKEIFDFISTDTHRRNEPNTTGMFNQLQNKIYNYVQEKSTSPSLLDEETDKKAKEFFVVYTQE